MSLGAVVEASKLTSWLCRLETWTVTELEPAQTPLDNTAHIVACRIHIPPFGKRGLHILYLSQRIPLGKMK